MHTNVQQRAQSTGRHRPVCHSRFTTTSAASRRPADARCARAASSAPSATVQLLVPPPLLGLARPPDCCCRCKQAAKRCSPNAAAAALYTAKVSRRWGQGLWESCMCLQLAQLPHRGMACSSSKRRPVQARTPTAELTLPYSKHVEQLLQHLCLQPPRSRQQLWWSCRRRTCCRCACCQSCAVWCAAGGQAKVSGRFAHQPLCRLC